MPVDYFKFFYFEVVTTIPRENNRYVVACDDVRIGILRYPWLVPIYGVATTHHNYACKNGRERPHVPTWPFARLRHRSSARRLLQTTPAASAPRVEAV
jgi:hypothetical protein